MYSEPTNPVRVVVLHDGRGRGQVVVPVSHLLDLKLLNSLVERELVPMRQADIVALTRAGKLTQAESAPVFFVLPTILDEAVAAHAECQYEIATVDGIERRQVALSTVREALRKSTCRVRVIRCTVPGEQLQLRPPASTNDLDQIFNSIRNFTTLRIKQRLEETLEIPPLPQTAQRIIALRANPDAAVNDLAAIVEADASLAAQVVSWASSPYYAAPSKIRSVQDAIMRVLGLDLVSNLALGMALGNSLAIPKDYPAEFTPYWQQSVFCSTAVEALVKLMPPAKRPSIGLASLSGLLHNFGYLVLAHTFPPHFASICRYVEANPHISHTAIDHHLLGVTRDQISAWLMQLWNMPSEVSVALRFQNESDYEGEHCVYAHLIFIAMRILRHHGIGDVPPEEIPLSLYQRHDLDPMKVAAAIDKVIASSEDIKKMAENFK